MKRQEEEKILFSWGDEEEGRVGGVDFCFLGGDEEEGGQGGSMRE
jgi:hypothetical protein